MIVACCPHYGFTRNEYYLNVIKISRTIFQAEGIEGDIIFRQYSRFDPTFITIDLKPARDDLERKLLFGSQVGGYKIHELPRMPTTTITPAIPPCLSTKLVYNPANVEENSKLPPPGMQLDYYLTIMLNGHRIHLKFPR